MMSLDKIIEKAREEMKTKGVSFKILPLGKEKEGNDELEHKSNEISF